MDIVSICNSDTKHLQSDLDFTNSEEKRDFSPENWKHVKVKMLTMLKCGHTLTIKLKAPGHLNFCYSDFGS